MEPAQFREYWGVTNEELAQLTGWSLDSVNHWFATGTNKRPVPSAARNLLAMIHSKWQEWQAEETLPAQVEEIYLNVIARKRASEP